jgi:hypothetical protein
MLRRDGANFVFLCQSLITSRRKEQPAAMNGRLGRENVGRVSGWVSTGRLARIVKRGPAKCQPFRFAVRSTADRKMCGSEDWQRDYKKARSNKKSKLAAISATPLLCQNALESTLNIWRISGQAGVEISFHFKRGRTKGIALIAISTDFLFLSGRNLAIAALSPSTSWATPAWQNIRRPPMKPSRRADLYLRFVTGNAPAELARPRCSEGRGA